MPAGQLRSRKSQIQTDPVPGIVSPYHGVTTGLHTPYFGLANPANDYQGPHGDRTAGRLLNGLYGITTESLQLFVPHRTARVMDAIENILGIAVGTGIYWLVLRLNPKVAAGLGKSAAEENAAGE